MRLRGRADIARTICNECGIETRSPLVVVSSDDKLYCKYKVRLYELELNRLLLSYSITHDPQVQKDIEFYIRCSESLCDFAIERGVHVEVLYQLIDRYYSLL